MHALAVCKMDMAILDEWRSRVLHILKAQESVSVSFSLPAHADPNSRPSRCPSTTNCSVGGHIKGALVVWARRGPKERVIETQRAAYFVDIGRRRHGLQG
jgi:hypothetical protein